MKFYKATGDDAYTLYAETSDSLYCEIHHPSGDVGDVHEVSEQYPIERIKGQFGAEEIEPDEITGLFGVKGQILDTLESAGTLTTDEIHERIDAQSANTTYGSLKHLAWDGVIERQSADEWK